MVFRICRHWELAFVRPTSLGLCASAAPTWTDPERCSSGHYATTTADTPTKPVGHGYGFRTRFKDMSSEELEGLLETSKGKSQVSPNRVVKVKPPIPAHRQHAFAEQWTRVDRITAPYEPSLINRTDMFAVIEAAHGQFKGAAARFPPVCLTRPTISQHISVSIWCTCSGAR